MKKYTVLFLVIAILFFLFIFSVSSAVIKSESTQKQSLKEKAYCLLYPSRCGADTEVSSTTVLTSTSVSLLETKNEDKGIITNTMSWIRSLKSNKLETKLLCVENVCINKSQFFKMVQLVNNESPVLSISFTTSDGNGTTTKIITR